MHNSSELQSEHRHLSSKYCFCVSKSIAATRLIIGIYCNATIWQEIHSWSPRGRSWSPRGTIGSESRDWYACSVVACSAEGDAARKARLGHCDDVVCSMRLRFPDAVYLDYSFQEIAKKKMDLRLDLRLACGGKRKTVRPVFPQKTF